ncbi:MAG: DUF1501 domain-containing protein [Wenzhouxiangellaceae bacterium]
MTNNRARREFLRLLGVGGARLALGALGVSAFARHAFADDHCATGSWGRLVGNVGGWTCDNHSGYKILEIYLNLGASQWESFWLPGMGSPNFSDYGMGSLALSDLDWGANTGDFPCQAPDIPADFDDAQLFSTQSGGGNIYWGAPTRPIYQRSNIFSRCRMVTQYHDLLPHEAAIPYVLSGLRLGNARRAGAGTAIQHRARVVEPEQLLPVSYVLHRGAFASPDAASVTGTHPGFARPVVIRIQDDNAFVNSLARSGVSSESDELFLALRHEYRDRLRFRGAGSPVRSTDFEGYWVAAELLENAPAMQALFGDNILVRDTNVATCPEHPAATEPNTPAIKTMLDAAASLLSSGPARYVCAIDNGITNTYDTHGDGSSMHLLRTSANIYNVMHHLADIIHHPVDNPDGTLDLDDTMVVINTDFNRTPGINGNNGRDHWPYGYLTTFIGGPISGGQSILGRIDNAGFTEPQYRYSATDMRAAVLLAAGVDPFAENNYRVSDFSEAIQSGIATEAQIRDRLKGDILGV